MSTDWPYDPETGEILEDPVAVPNIAEFSVSELSFALKRTLEDTYGYVRVRGELGRVSRPGLGPRLSRLERRKGGALRCHLEGCSRPAEDPA